MMPHQRMAAALAASTLLVLPLPAIADFGATPPAAAWQTAISNQIEAYRAGDPTTAFSFAGARFQERFPDARTFFTATVAAGYDTIMQSRTENFGKYRLFDDNSVLQEVTLFGNDQSIRQAVFAMAEEPGGWRIEAVIIQPQSGYAV